MTALLVSHRFSTAYGAKVAAAAARDKVTVELLALPPDPAARLPESECARIINDGLEPMGGTPEDFGAFIRTEIENYANVIRIAGLRQQ